MLSASGYTIRRADNPAVIREQEENPPIENYSSESSEKLSRRTLLFQDDRGGKVIHAAGPSNNDISRQPVIPPRINPFVELGNTLQSRASVPPSTVKDATSNRPAKVPLADFKTIPTDES